MRARNKYISELIRFLNHYLGWRSWSVIVYNSVFENIFLIFYISLHNQLFSANFIFDFCIFLGFSIFSTSYGYLINDLADKELDALHGKENTFGDDSRIKAGLIVLLVFVLSICLGMRFVKNPGFVALWLCWGFIATFYSIRPIRLKERGKVGLISAVIAQRVLPTLIIFAAFKHYVLSDLIVFTVYVFFRGVSSDLNHQLEDYRKDLGTKTETYPVRTGLPKAQKVFRLSLETEKALLIFCLLVMYLNLRDFQILGIPVLLPALIAYLFLYGVNWLQIWSQGAEGDFNPFVPSRKDIFQFIHHAFPSVILPFYLLLLLAYEKWLFIFILLFFMILRKMYSLDLIRNSYPVRVILDITQE